MRAKKGSAFERDFCKQLTRWWLAAPGSEESLFWRTAGSGGRATTRAKSGLATHGACGDVTSTHPSTAAFSKVFALELKRGYNKATVHDFLDKPTRNKPCVYEQWVQQAIDSADAANTPFWWLVHKRDMKESTVTVPKSFLTTWKEEALAPFDVMARVLGMVEFSYVHTLGSHDQHMTVLTMRLEPFLVRLSPSDVKEYAGGL